MAKHKLILTERDIKVLKLFHDFGVVSSDQVARWLFPNVAKTTVLRRLRLLENAGYIRKRGTLPNATSVWVIECDGIRLLDGVPDKEFYPLNQLPHDITLNEIRWQFHSLDLVQSWMTERNLRQKLAKESSYKVRSGWVVPDALLLFQNFSKDNFSARIEVELTLKSDQRYEVQIQKYFGIYDQKRVFTWYFVRTRKMGERLLMLAKKYGPMDITGFFGVTVIDDFLKDPRRAKLTMIEKEFELWQLIKTPETETKPAQADAQGLSRKIA